MEVSRIDMDKMLRAFHSKYGHFKSELPTLDIPESVKELRKNLIREEFEEMMKALDENNLKEIADGGADLMYVIIGTFVSYGIPTNRIFQEVHRSNMTKTPVKVDGSTGQKYGTKTPKGPDFVPPDICSILLQPNETTLLEKTYKR